MSNSHDPILDSAADVPVGAAPHAATPNSNVSKLPPPLPPIALLEVPGERDPVVYAAWQKHIAKGFDQNSEMFRKVLDAFLRPYWLTVRMYQVLFAVGIIGIVAAVILGVWRGFEFAVLFGGLSIAAFLAFFVSQPLRSLEQNLHFITWLGVVYNTYWTRLMYANDPATVQTDLEAIKQNTIKDLTALIDKQAELAAKRPSTTINS